MCDTGFESTIDEISIENYCCAAYCCCCCCCLEFFRVHGGILQKYFVYCWIQVMCMMYNIEFYGTDVWRSSGKVDATISTTHFPGTHSKIFMKKVLKFKFKSKIFENYIWKSLTEYAKILLTFLVICHKCKSFRIRYFKKKFSIASSQDYKRGENPCVMGTQVTRKQT